MEMLSGARPPPGAATNAWDGQFPSFPVKPKRRAPPPGGIVTDMAAMNLNDASSDTSSPRVIPHPRRPSLQMQYPAYRPTPGHPPRSLGTDGSGMPVRALSDRQPMVGAPSNSSPYGHPPSATERAFTLAEGAEPPPGRQVLRSATMPIPPAAPASPPVTRPMYPGQATYQEFAPSTVSSPAITHQPSFSRPNTAGAPRPNTTRSNVNSGGQFYRGLDEPVSDPATPYGIQPMTQNSYGLSGQEVPEMPNFDAMPDVNSGSTVDESLPGLQPSIPRTSGGPPSRGHYAAFKSNFPAQAHRAQSQPNLKATGPNDYEFCLPVDVPPVPPLNVGYGQGRPPPNVHEEPFPLHYRSRSPVMPMGRTYAPPPTTQPYGGNGPVRPFRVNTNLPPMPNTAETPNSQSSETLAHHPVPFRPGLASKSAGPGPMGQRNFANLPSAQGRVVANEPQPQPVTNEELQQLHFMVKSKQCDSNTQLQLAKKLAEASVVLVKNETRVDAKAKSKIRDKYNSDAYKLVKKLVHQGNAEAQFYLGDCYSHGYLGLQVDRKEAYHLYQAAAKQEHAQSAYRVAVCCEIGHEHGGGTKRDPLRAVHWYKRAAALGYPPAMYKMGMISLKGLLGQGRNEIEGVNWLKRAADRADEENPHALHELALMYESARPGDVVVRDEYHARDLFHQAAELGYKFSQFRLGAAYEYGLMGCPVDQRLSIMWYSRAAAQGEHQSELSLSGWYLTGLEGILIQSDTEAYLWARKAASAGLPKAEYAMGYFTEVGIGIPPNLEDAKRWYWRAAGELVEE